MGFASEDLEHPLAVSAERRPSLVIRNARVLTCDQQWTEWADADIVVDGGRIVAIGPGVAGPTEVSARDIDASGRLALPGMVTATDGAQTPALTRMPRPVWGEAPICIHIASPA